MDREAKTYFRWLIIAALFIAVMNLLGCVRPQVRPTPKDGTVVVSPLVENNLDFLYFSIGEKAGLEAWFCLQGFADPKTRNVLIQTISPVWVDSADGSNIVGRPSGCPKETVGTVHFHPGVGFCSLSNIDINTAHWLPYPLTAIVCRDQDGKYQFQVTTREVFDKAWNELPECGNCTIRSFTPLYRFKPP